MTLVTLTSILFIVTSYNKHCRPGEKQDNLQISVTPSSVMLLIVTLIIASTPKSYNETN